MNGDYEGKNQQTAEYKIHFLERKSVKNGLKWSISWSYQDDLCVCGFIAVIDSLYMCVWKVGMERSFASFAPALVIALDCPSLKPNASIIGFH